MILGVWTIAHESLSEGLGFRVEGKPSLKVTRKHMGIGLNSLKYGVLYLGSHYNTGPYINFPHFVNSNLGKLPYDLTDSYW